MAGKLKNTLFSENGMKLVNGLFIVGMFFLRTGVMLAAYACWIVYLVYCIRHTASKTVRTVFAVFIILAAAWIAVNLYYRLRVF